MSGDKYSAQYVLGVIRRETAKTSLRETARRHGISAAYLSDILRGQRQLSKRIAAAFGFEREILTLTVFRRKE